MARTTPINSGYTIINGAGTGSNGSRIDVWMEYLIVSQDIANNFTNIQVYFYAALRAGQSSNTSYDSGMNSTLTVDGVAGNGVSNAAYDFRSAENIHYLGGFNGNIVHNADGTRSVGVSGSFSTRSSYISGGTVSGTITLPTIPRATGISCPNATMGSAVTITLSPASSAFTHNVRYVFGSKSGTIATGTKATSISYTFPVDLATVIPSAATGVGSVICDTYNGSTLIGSKAVTVTLTVPTSVVPTISSLSVADAGGVVPATWGVYVQGKSKAHVTINGATGAQGSTIRSYAISGGGFSGATNPFTTGALNTAGSISFSGTVKDSRGRSSATKTASITVQAYANPKLSSVKMFRCDENGVAADAGTYLSVSFTQTVSSCNGHNSATVKVRYKPTTSSAWVTSESLLADTATILAGFDASTSYDLSLEITDAFITVSHAQVLATASRILNVNASGKGLAIGKMSEKDAFEVGWPTEFSEIPTVDGQPLLHMSHLPEMQEGIEYRTTEYFNGQPMYAKRISLGTFPTGYFYIRDTGVNGQTLIKYEGKIWDAAALNIYSLPCKSAELLSFDRAYGSGTLALWPTNLDWAGWTGWLNLYYIK